MDREVGLPMIAIQYPEATGCAYSLASLRRIASLPNVVAIVRQRERPGRELYEQYRKRFYDALLMAGLPEQ